MDDICKDCWNDGCKKQSEEFRNNKLPVCRDMIEHPEHWGEENVCEDCWFYVNGQCERVGGCRYD